MKIYHFACASALVLMAATDAAAQTTPPPVDEVEAVVVTGSRIARRDYVSATPIATASDTTLLQSGKVNLESALQQLPQFSPARDETDNGGALGGAGRATIDLRGLGENRTLVLLDGRRLPPSNGQLVVDLNTVPLGVVESVEVITGGASSVYGSDAVAGVVNIKTKRNFRGVQLQASHGGSFDGDAGRNDLTITAGSGFDEDKGHALFSMSYTDRDTVPNTARDFFKVGGPSGTMFFGAYAPTPTNLPSRAAVDAVFAKYGAPAGSVAPGTSFGFNSDGTLFTNIAPLRNYKGPGEEEGYFTNTGVLIYQTARDAWLVTPMQRISAFSKVDYDFTPSLHGYGQVIFTDSTVKTQIGYTPTIGFGSLTIPVTNPFIPTELRTLLASRADPTAPFAYSKRFNELGPRAWDEAFTTYQVLLGLGGDLTKIDGSWDIFGSRSRMRLLETRHDGVFIAPLQQLLNAADGGASLCAGGFNPFGGLAGTVSPACKALITNDVKAITIVDQNNIEASVQGRAFTLPAGDVRYSLAATYRDNKFSYSPDAAEVRGLIIAGNGTNATTGSISAKEASGELLVPLLRDQALAKSLNLGLSYRYSHYNTAGSNSTYKASADWRVADPILLRGGYSRAVRAPNPVELFSAPIGGAFQLGSPPQAGDPCDIGSSGRSGASAGQVRTLCLATGVPAPLLDSYRFTQGAAQTITTGNRMLQPETADTYTAGIVLSPEFDFALLRNPVLTIDYYDIRIEDAISQVSANTAMAKCYNLDGSNSSYTASNSFCQLISRDAGGIPTVQVPFLNLAAYRTRGIDINFNNRIELADLGLGDNGVIRISSAFTYLRDFSVQSLAGAAFVDYAGTVANVGSVPPSQPKWKGITTFSYEADRFNIGLRWRFIDSMRDVTAVTRPATPLKGVPSYNYFDLTAGVKLLDNVSLDATVVNLAGKDPPIVGEVLGNTNRSLYDVLGRTYTLRLTATF